jgi:predicted Zn-dependent protease with MMP-like domain
MSNVEDSFLHDPEALIDLLEDIVASYRDNDSRPVDALSLYRQRLLLGASHRVKLAKRFVVVDGGASQKRAGWSRERNVVFGQPHLKLVAKATTPLALP